MKPISGILPPIPAQNLTEVESAPPDAIQDVCANCKNGIYVKMPGQTGLQPCPMCDAGRAESARLFDLRFQNSQMPPEYRHASLTTWHIDLTPELIAGKMLAKALLEEFVASNGIVSLHNALNRIPVALPRSLQNLLQQPDDVRYGAALYGTYGMGKTNLAASAVNDLRQRGTGALYARIQDIMADATATWGSRDESDVDVISRYRDVDVLFIDDFNLHVDDRTQLKRHELSYAETILRYRNAHHKPTLITCNLPPQAFVEQWGQRTGEAALQLCHWVKVGGKKVRRTGQPLQGVAL